jgi:hypothetical protein
MKQLAIILVFVLMCLAPPAPTQQAKDTPSAQAIPLCAVIANAARYDGKEIMIRGLYRMEIHGFILMDRGCSKTQASLRRSPGYRAEKSVAKVLRSAAKKDEFQPVEVVYLGIFRVAKEGQCFGEFCAGYEIEITELVSARFDAPANGRATSVPAADTLLRESDHPNVTGVPPALPGWQQQFDIYGSRFLGRLLSMQSHAE